MRKFTFLLVLLLVFKFAEAQRFEAGGFIGGNNLISDVGRDFYVFPNRPTIGGVFKWNTNERLALRANVYYSISSGKVIDSSLPYSGVLIGPEGIAFSEYNKGVGSGDIIFEWSFFSYDLRKRKAATPYMFAGLGAILYEGKDGVAHEAHNVEYIMPIGNYELTPSMIVGGGYKMKVSPSFVLGVDLGFRYAYSDNLDNSASVKVGNLNTNDWLTTLGVTITYIFGRDPCACGQ